jgi:signal peptidase II
MVDEILVRNDGKSRNGRRHAVAVFLALGVVAVCFVIRATIQATMILTQEIRVIPGLFSLRYVRNPGAAFSLFAGMSADFRLPFLIGVGVVALIVLTWMYFRAVAESRLEPRGLATLAGGATANLLERVVAGDVLDYLDFFLGPYHWPTFNLADVAINVGISLLLVDAWQRRSAAAGRR